LSIGPANSDDSDLKSADYSAPTRSCDIVMKGGITSGVVYPHAVCELAQTYRFRNVGGTSAGAIAAAATAAAEYGRSREGFNALAELPDWLGAGTNLRSLFQPQKTTRKLYAVLLAGIDGGPRAAIVAAIGEHPLMTIAGALPALVLTAFALLGAGATDSTLLSILGWGAAALVGLPLMALGVFLAVGARIAWEANGKIPDNDFGLCSGATSGEFGVAKALTPWLHEKINGYAGLPAERPLTFGHLWAGPDRDREQEWDSEDRFLNLEMMTTNLVNRRARQLPWEEEDWFFNPEEFRRFFPEEVVEWMESRSPNSLPYDGTTQGRKSRVRLALAREQGLLALPPAKDIPVLVATRMSLSFPILLSAVPLWRFDMTREKNKVLGAWRNWAGAKGPEWDPLTTIGKWPEGQPTTKPTAECCWFSDGGISSNFPVHFFDRLVPRWPTFGINLRPFSLDEEREEDETDNSWMVESNSDSIAEWWFRFPEAQKGFKDKRLGVFLSSIVRTMQNRIDEAQMRVPGYRDRIAHVSMSEEEGGMNLTMPEETIEALTRRGRGAARRLRDAYTPPYPEGAVINWDNHRWVRFRSSLAVLEEMNYLFARGQGAAPLKEDERSYDELLADPPSYPLKPKWKAQVADVEVKAIKEVAKAADHAPGSVADGAPSPTPIGRIVPRD
jgi:predicted acylesterase/phospholipase RssA